MEEGKFLSTHLGAASSYSQLGELRPGVAAFLDRCRRFPVMFTSRWSMVLSLVHSHTMTDD